jgi:hypothetical protein
MNSHALKVRVTVNLRLMSADIYTASNGRFFYSRKAAKYTFVIPPIAGILQLYMAISQLSRTQMTDAKTPLFALHPFPHLLTAGVLFTLYGLWPIVKCCRLWLIARHEFETDFCAQSKKFQGKRRNFPDGAFGTL